MAQDKWKRHNAPNGEHIWCGNKHIADIVTNTDKPGLDDNVIEIAKSAILMHNDPKFRVADELYEALKRSLNALELALQIIGSNDKIFVANISKLLTDDRQAIAKAEGK